MGPRRHRRYQTPHMPKLYFLFELYRRHDHVQFAPFVSTGTFCRERSATGIECRFQNDSDGCDEVTAGGPTYVDRLRFQQVGHSCPTTQKRQLFLERS